MTLISLVFAISLGYSIANQSEFVETASASELPKDNFYSFEPLLFTPECESVDKSSVAFTFKTRGIHFQKICFTPGDVYRDWRWTFGDDGEVGYSMAEVWCDEHKHPYLTLFQAELDDYEAENGEPYSGFVLWANEPDRPDQCDISVDAVAQLFIDLVDICPTCKLIGPMYSTADSGIKVSQVWNRVGELCDCNPHQLQQFYGHSLHIFPRGPQDPSDPNYTNWQPSIRVDQLCEWVEGKTDCEKPVWITGFGWHRCWPEPYENFRFWLEDAYADDRVEFMFIYATFTDGEQNPSCPFSGIFDNQYYIQTGEFRLTDFGRAYVDARND